MQIPCRLEFYGSVFALYFVIIHKGAGAYGGHFYAYGRSSEDAVKAVTDEPEKTCYGAKNSWFKFNDTNVQSASFQDIFSEESNKVPHTPYILAYAKVPHHQS